MNMTRARLNKLITIAVAVSFWWSSTCYPADDQAEVFEYAIWSRKWSRDEWQFVGRLMFDIHKKTFIYEWECSEEWLSKNTRITTFTQPTGDRSAKHQVAKAAFDGDNWTSVAYEVSTGKPAAACLIPSPLPPSADIEFYRKNESVRGYSSIVFLDNCPLHVALHGLDRSSFDLGALLGELRETVASKGNEVKLPACVLNVTYGDSAAPDAIELRFTYQSTQMPALPYGRSLKFARLTDSPRTKEFEKKIRLSDLVYDVPIVAGPRRSGMEVR